MFALRKDEPGAVRRATVRRLRQRAGRQVGQQARKRRPRGKSLPVPPRALSPHHVWSDDCVPDEPTEGRRLTCLPVREESTRAGLPMDGARAITAGAGVPVLQRRCAQRGTPPDVQSAHGPECMAPQGTAWLHAHDVHMHCSDPGSPWQHGHNERFHGGFRDGCLNRWLFAAVQAARCIMNNWREEDNDERPPGALDGLPPTACAAQYRCQSPQAA
jgi:putative transposase